MKRVLVKLDNLEINSEMIRSKESKVFEEHLRASIEEIGLVEPIKVALLSKDRYLVVDGVMRVRAISSIRVNNPSAFELIPAYVVDYSKRFEIRYQLDIYQDLLPSQLAVLVEHLHKSEKVRKVDIARFIGVSPPTIRNYTGLWRLLQRGGLFARLVGLMDVGVIPSSNPYAWLRLNAKGIRHVLETSFSDGEIAERWIDRTVQSARQGTVMRFQNKFVETSTDSLDAEYYREDEQVRNRKRDLGKRRGAATIVVTLSNASDAIKHLNGVTRWSSEPVLQIAARAFSGYLK
jgi:hypothetical protein